MDINKLIPDAQRHFLKREYKESIEVFTKIIEAGEAQEMAHLSRGTAYFQLKEYEKAIVDFNRVVELNDQNSRAYYFLGMSFLMKREFADSISALDKSIKLKPDNKSAFFTRGIAHAEAGNEDEAAKNIKTALMSAESDVQNFADNYGMFRTQFEKAFSLMTGEKEPPTETLNDEEKGKLMNWLEETEKNEGA
jgi:tetratricopeptide (TPR) repeat protein